MQSVIAYYPERQYKVYVVGVSLATRSIYTILKPLLPKRTLNKIIFVGNKTEEIQQALLNDIDINNIPKKYGGNHPYVLE